MGTSLRVGDKGPEVRKLREGLNRLGFHPGPADDSFDALAKTALEAFQRKNNLIPDGVFGHISAKKYNAQVKAIYQVTLEALPVITEQDSPKLMAFVKCVADKVSGYDGYMTLQLREDVAVKYDQLRASLQAKGCVVTTAGGLRALTAQVSASRSQTSFHYTGRAFDLSTSTGMQNPDKDPYVVVRDAQDARKWVVWARVVSTPKVPSQPEVTLEAEYVVPLKGGKTQIKKKTVSGEFVNFTELAATFGFRGISGRNYFFAGGDYMGAEWWHMQHTADLMVGQSTFGQEMLKVYSLVDLRKYLPQWETVKSFRYGIEWN